MVTHFIIVQVTYKLHVLIAIIIIIIIIIIIAFICC